MKKLLMLSLASVMILSSFSCGKKDDNLQQKSENRDAASITYEPAEKAIEKEKTVVEIEEIDESILTNGDDLEINYLDEMNGYWVHPEGYEKRGNEIFTSFLVESDLGIWTPYYDGTAGQALKCTGDVDGLHLEDLDGGTISYTYDGIALLESDGTVAFERSDKIPE